MIRAFEEFRAWVTLTDYDSAKAQAARDLEERLTRGNTASQNGSALEQDELACLSHEADEAMERIQQRVPTAL